MLSNHVISKVKLRLKVREIAKEFLYAFFESSLPTVTPKKSPKGKTQGNFFSGGKILATFFPEASFWKKYENFTNS